MTTQNLKYGDKIVVQFPRGQKHRNRVFIALDPVDPKMVVYSNGARGVFYSAPLSSVEKQKEPVHHYGWVNVYEDGLGSTVYASQSAAMQCQGPRVRVTCIQIRYAIEV